MSRALRVGALAVVLAAAAAGFAATEAGPTGASPPVRRGDPVARGLASAAARAALPVAIRGAATGADQPAPADLSVEIAGDGAALRLTVRRPGHLVFVSDGVARAAGEDWVAVALDPRVRLAQRAPVFVWETTPIDSLAAVRGEVRLRSVRGALAPELVATGAPQVVARHEGKRHRCEAARDGRGGFVVSCLVDPKARRVGAASWVGARALEDVWMARARPGRPTLVRLDVPVAPGGAAARLLGYLDGVTAITVRAEASWVLGEAAPRFFLGASSKAQPVVP